MTEFTLDAPGIHFEDHGDRIVIQIDARADAFPFLRTRAIQNVIATIEATARRRPDGRGARAIRSEEPRRPAGYPTTSLPAALTKP
ncbi:hypothetical protein [Phreatobacter sp. AB_2022a]|uniref:hypothetical protein n=1 Tax=Phreatobacter sp. AB_2022a TaxID=3003134 RepID=UPI002286F3AD|nr:hypothetical protein [Phreatobacter sp. AB_2022a]MCZ0733748.1 hypothetical protein [Phreatobacter sp. AB_2022a]